MGQRSVSLVRWLIACALLATVAGVAWPGATQSSAAGAGKVYMNTALHYSLTYPTGWTLDAKKAAKSIGAIEGTINSVALVITAADDSAVFQVLVKTTATTNATITANISGMLKEGANLIGPVKFGTAKVKGITYVSGWATEKASPTLTAYGYINGVSHGRFTYYAGGAYLLKQANSAADYAAMQSIMGSFTLL